MTNKITEHDCIKDQQIQAQSRKIERLEARADFKDQRIEEMNKKLDKINESLQDLKEKSNQDDFNIDARVTAIESKIETLKWVYGALVVVFAGLTFYMNYLH